MLLPHHRRIFLPSFTQQESSFSPSCKPFFDSIGHGEKNSRRAYFGCIAPISGIPAFRNGGTRRYLAGHPNETFLDDLLRRLIAQAGIPPLDLPEDIRIRDNGAIRFVFNYGREANLRRRGSSA
jgi:hypothetical protein